MQEQRNGNEDMDCEWEDPEEEEKIYPCPVCGKIAFPRVHSYEFCENCGWQDDSYQQEFPDEDIGLNYLSLNDARLAYKKGIPLLKAKHAYLDGRLDELLGR